MLADMLTHCIAFLGAAGIGATIGVRIWFALRHADTDTDASAAADRPASFTRMRRPAAPPCTRRRPTRTTRASAHHQN